jgi:hypothetical protein
MNTGRTLFAQLVDSHNTKGRGIFWRFSSKVSVEGGRKRVRRGVRHPVAEWDKNNVIVDKRGKPLLAGLRQIQSLAQWWVRLKTPHTQQI